MEFVQPIIPAEQIEKLESILEKCVSRPNQALDEYEVYDFLEVLGLPTPPRIFIPAGTDPSKIGEMLPKGVEKFVAKVVVDGLTHKTEAKGVLFNVTPADADKAWNDFTSRFPPEKYKGTLFVQMLPMKGSLGDEILISLFQDHDFGPMIALGFGGTLVEELKEQMKPNRANLFLPSNMNLDENRKLLENLPLVRILTGVARGTKKRLELDVLINQLKKLQWASSYFSVFNRNSKFSLEELEVNPATVHDGHLIALDGVLRAKRLTFRHGCDNSSSSATPSACCECGSKAALSAEEIAALPLSMIPKPLGKIEKMLHPKSVMIAGASGKRRDNPGSIMARKARENGSIPLESIYLLHPAEKVVEGCTCYKTMNEVLEKRGGEPVDLLIVAVGAGSAKKLCEESFDMHAAESMLIVTAGFAETETGGAIQHEMEQKLNTLNMTPEKRPVICGPNTLGFTSKGSIDTLFTPQYKSSSGVLTMKESEGGLVPDAVFDAPAEEKAKKMPYLGAENVVIISQSGAQLISRSSDLVGIINPCMSVSVGNQLDLSVTDFLEYVIMDIMNSREHPDGSAKSRYDGVSAIGLYIEGFNQGEGRRLIKLLHMAAELSIIVVVYKSGRTAQGKDAAKGHTASMAGDYDMFSFLIRSAGRGAVVCDSFEEYEQILMCCALMPSFSALRRPMTKAAGVGMVSNAGYEKCCLADHLFRGNPSSIALTQWSPETSAKIEELFVSAGLKGVIDISPVLDVTPMLPENRWCDLCEIMLSDAGCDAAVLTTVPESIQFKVREKGPGHPEDVDAPGGFIDRIVALKEKFGKEKPFVVSIESGNLYRHVTSELIARGIPVFRRADAAARAVGKIIIAMRGEVL
ncbi:putative CoA binding domain containing protein [Monocercomonoides exilis]|uniref:putative CoA binding domain containing protein n=1 Tax=Monocercomonoides exilis TaxID=2049356 RepID=UPI003559BF86|nr:putative CoA binding domain containing protein [Monocercomonoides exilis]|eukprot:MONOS_8944.1-p1 / transcript=MONOS_8944.1 / gene=MONOS_8944 / organism=Monocercomonoides_exilis_PA203 / gene_product=CoA binding domain containing protein / transcript_product=CoA binding domain containing protein / location=Mono_scaffold00352:48985-51634(-) / protein_length=862 / sequence_SO=supercontig / SO=protein_coding / is_pseudo=false